MRPDTAAAIPKSRLTTSPVDRSNSGTSASTIGLTATDESTRTVSGGPGDAVSIVLRARNTSACRIGRDSTPVSSLRQQASGARQLPDARDAVRDLFAIGVLTLMNGHIKHRVLPAGKDVCDNQGTHHPDRRADTGDVEPEPARVVRQDRRESRSLLDARRQVRVWLNGRIFVVPG